MDVVFERFTERARQVVVLAQAEARELGHDYIGTEHLLLGLLREEEGVAARVLANLAVDLETTRAAIVQAVGSGEAVTSGQIPFTPRAKKALELAMREALALHDSFIGTEHILLAVARANEGVAAEVLHAAGADPERIRNRVIQLLADPAVRRGEREGEPSHALPEMRLALLEALLAAWERRAEIFAIAAEAPDSADARTRVAGLLRCSDEMAARILSRHLADMTQAEGARLREERDELRKRIDAGA